MTFKGLLYCASAAALTLGTAHAATITINAGGSSLAAPSYIAMFESYTTAHPTTLWSYEAVGSGAGQTAFLDNEISEFENVPAGTLTYGTIVGTQVDIGASDAALVASQLTNPATGSYPESSLDGPLIQVPTFATPVTIPYNQSAQTSVLKLTDAQLCGVLSGKITDWHSLNSHIASGTTIGVIYRSDGSGTTFLLTQHLNAVCTSANSSFPTYPVPITTHFYSTNPAQNPVFSTTPPPNFVGESGSANVATYAVATPDTLGYLSPDYTSIAPHSANTTSLKVASLVNATNGVAYQPTVGNTENGLANAGPGSTDELPPSNETAAMDPLNWVPLIPTTTSGYPIVGFTTMELSSCYANKPSGSAIISLLDNIYGSAYATIIKNNGFVQVSNTANSQYVTAIKADFLGNSSGYGLNIDNSSTCSSYVGR
jgi:ABC-type phosphate transport system substrate-binding protein